MGGRFSNGKKQDFFSQFRVLVHAGMGIPGALSLVSDCLEGKERECIDSLLAKVRGGSALWEAMQSHPEAFSPLDCHVVRAGEFSGRLDGTLQFLSAHYARKEQLRRTVVAAVTYPAITLAVAAVVLAFMLAVVVPMFEQVYLRMGGELPALTRTVIRMASRFPWFAVSVAALLAGAWAFFRLGGSSPRRQAALSRLCLSAPLLGNILKKAEISRMCGILSLLVSSGVPLLQALSLSEGVLRWLPYRESLRRVREAVEVGGTLHEAFSRHDALYGRKFLAMVKVGEEAHALGDMLRTLSEDASAVLQQRLRQMEGFLEPVLVTLVGVVVAFVLIAMYLPMFQMGMTLQ